MSQPPMSSMLTLLPTKMIGLAVPNAALESPFVSRDRLVMAHAPGLVESAKSTINPFS